MESHEVLRRAVNGLGVKSIAAEMNLSTSLIYKWCQAKDHPDACGADNPLDRLDRIVSLTADRAPVEWLCRRAGGFFVKSPPQQPCDDLTPLRATRTILKEFSELLEVVSSSIADDQRIDAGEALNIRDVWERLKREAESFVTACEAGSYRGAPSEGNKAEDGRSFGLATAMGET